MEVRHANAELERLEFETEYLGGLDRSLVRALRKVLLIVRTVENETKLYSYKSLRFEKLKGSRSHQRAVRLNRQWRLILEIEKGEQGNTVVVQAIEDYH